MKTSIRTRVNRPAFEHEVQEGFTIYTKVKCEYCGLEICYGERWIHISRHQQGLKQKMSLCAKIDLETVKLPWYMHSIYQDLSVNRSRYEIINFTEITRDAMYYEMEKRVTKSFATHFWINYNGKKTGDAIKDFFGLKPSTVEYSVFDRFSFQIREENDVYAAFECSFCSFRNRRRPTVIQTILGALVHALHAHAEKKQLYAACLEDIAAIQESTGIQTYLKQVPNYTHVLIHDLVFDIYYSRDVLSPPSSTVAFATYCLLCFGIIGKTDTYNIRAHFTKFHKGVAISHAMTSFDCISAARYGQPVSMSFKNHYFPLMMVESEDKSEFSWACFMCEKSLKHIDSTQLIIYIAAHISKSLGFCNTERPTLSGFKVEKTAIHAKIDQLFSSQWSECKKTIGVWNVQLQPVTLKMVASGFVKLSLDDFLNKWIPKATDTVIGKIELCTRFNTFKRVYDARPANSFLYICPYCFIYFINKYMAFLHLRPGQCSQMVGFLLPLKDKDIERSLRKDTNLLDPR
ncbi:hypothetical protein M3Y97_00154800 [Aphelenchoides bicaudatus]|nr:hypothetical protein M3Y97_00154800 [Aphelenchoides bicaudatus]